MSIESAEKFVEKLKTDAAFTTSLEKAASDDDRRALVQAAGFNFTKAELKEAMAGGTELSDADLDAVAGGRPVDWVAAGGTVVTAVAAAF